MKKFSVTIGIPTFEANSSIALTLNSIYDQELFHSIYELVLLVDGGHISSLTLQKIVNPKLKIIYVKNRVGQAASINRILKNNTSQLLILTNDDVIWEKNTLEKLIKEFKKSKTDLISACVRPLPTTNLYEKIIQLGSQIGHSISLSWKRGDNYLACNGRLIALSSRLTKKIILPKKLWNNDAFIFIINHLLGFKYKHVEDAVCYYKSPGTITEYHNQSIKFQNSQKENQAFFKSDISSFYKIPTILIFLSLWKIMKKRPICMLLYFIIYLIGKFKSLREIDKFPERDFWETDKSTKILPYAD